MKANIIIFLSFLTFLSITTSGQTKSDTENKIGNKHKFAFGFIAGFSRGYDDGKLAYPEGGLSFKFTPNRFGVQTTFFPRLSVNLDFMFNLVTVGSTSFYLYQGNQFVLDDNLYNDESISNTFNNGLGIGIEYTTPKLAGINLRFGYSFYNDFTAFRRRFELGFYQKF